MSPPGLLFLVFAGLAFVGPFLELAVFLARPELLVWCAVLKAGEPRTLKLTPPAVAYLTVTDVAKTSYREAPQASLDLSRIGGPRVTEGEPTELGGRRPLLVFDPAKARFIARDAFSFRRKARSLVVVDMVPIGTDGIELRPRYFAGPILSVLAFLLVVSIVWFPISLAVLVLFSTILVLHTAWAGAYSVPPLVEEVEFEIGRRLKALELHAKLRVDLGDEGTAEGADEHENANNRRGVA